MHVERSGLPPCVTRTSGTMADPCQGSSEVLQIEIPKVFVIFQNRILSPSSEPNMSFEDAAELINTEMGSFTKKHPQILENMMKSMPGGADAKVDFPGFLRIIGGMMMACNEPLLTCLPSTENPTVLESTMKHFIDVFHNYASKDDQMDRSEFETLMQTEFRSMTDKDPDIVNQLMKSVDGSTDGEQDIKMNFQQFMTMMGKINGCH